MSEPRKNHLSIDGGQVKEDDHVASYKPIPDSDAEFRTSKSSLSKSKEKVSADGAEEKLLSKEDEAKIVRVDMADAKYVVGDHRNGDAKIELDANKRQFSGLTKEELMKYAEDPFWVNLRWCMFVLFWTMWVAMLAGAVTIIVRAPKCAPPTPREWFEKWPLADSETALDYAEMESELPVLKTALIQGIFMEVPTYDVDEPDVLAKFKAFVAKAKEFGIKVIVDLTPNYVSINHPWFVQSENRSSFYSDYFVWAAGKEFDDAGKTKPPNNWVSTLNTPAWSYSAVRGEFYLHQYGVDQPDLNFNNHHVVAEFESVLEKWMKAGAQGVRLNKARQLLVNSTLPDEVPATGRGAALTDHGSYAYWRHRHTSDQEKLDALLDKFGSVVDANAPTPNAGESVFTLKELGDRPELHLLSRKLSSLRPPSAAPVSVNDASAAATDINTRLKGHWPALQLKGDEESAPELALFAMLLPATPVLDVKQIEKDVNDTTLSDLVSLRVDASIEHGNYSVSAVPVGNATDEHLLACARWKVGHTGYVAVFNPGVGERRANLTAVPSVPDTVTVHQMSRNVKLYTNYTKNYAEHSDNVLVPPKSTIVLSYVPQTTAES